ncbi:High-affnity carbon uptake protein Hat/HatR [Nostoc sphaeroides CCNUC1]|uniref:High-affnity carbon uptake protein Hat/HatR n=2 Tax=Nostoc sphaeroides TaxID=446679 RepID=A0A5P8WK67_9NOSO|nr:High-affnity carbon uptake protein Hat/HatR [Nostoc sphaeroides CCNUC1]
MKATARLAGVSDRAILKVLASADLKPSKLTQMLMDKGFAGADLNSWRTEGIPDIAVGIILNYYAYLAGRYCTQQARLVCEAFGTIGVRAWIQDALPGFLTKLEEIGVKNCQNVYCKRIPAALLYDPK